MLNGIFALNGAPKVKRIARTMFWLAFISAASRHDILLGVVLYPIAVFTVMAIGTSWLWMPGLLLLAWYWHCHHRELVGGCLPRLRVPWPAAANPTMVAGEHLHQPAASLTKHPPWREIARRAGSRRDSPRQPVLRIPQRQAPPPGEPPAVAFDRALARLQQRTRPPA